jgi:hypothetical protein
LPVSGSSGFGARQSHPGALEQRRAKLGVIRSDNFALFINIVLCIVGILTMLLSNDVIEREQIPSGSTTR